MFAAILPFFGKAFVGMGGLAASAIFHLIRRFMTQALFQALIIKLAKIGFAHWKAKTKSEEVKELIGLLEKALDEPGAV